MAINNNYSNFTTTNAKNKKSIILFSAIGIIIIIALFFIISAFFPATVDEPCDWCNDSPSIAYKTKSGSTSYVCKSCSSECAFCGNPATKHYENMLEMMVFVCDDCYESM